MIPDNEGFFDDLPNSNSCRAKDRGVNFLGKRERLAVTVRTMRERLRKMQAAITKTEEKIEKIRSKEDSEDNADESDS